MDKRLFPGLILLLFLGLLITGEVGAEKIRSAVPGLTLNISQEYSRIRDQAGFKMDTPVQAEKFCCLPWIAEVKRETEQRGK